MKLVSTTLAKAWISTVIIAQLLLGSVAYGTSSMDDKAKVSEITVSQMEIPQEHSASCNDGCSASIDVKVTACERCLGPAIIAGSVPPAVLHLPVMDSMSEAYPVVVYLELNLPPPK